MDIGDFVRSFFGLSGGRHRNFSPPPNHMPEHHENDCDCHDHDSYSNPNPTNESPGFNFFFGNGDRSLDDMFHHFHGDMNRQMEFIQRQMEDMMRGFGNIASENGPRILDKPESPPGGKGQRPPIFHFDFNLPFQPNKRADDPRSFMLKEDGDKSSKAMHPPPSNDGLFRRFFPQQQPRPDQRKDTDLDGKVSDADALALIKKSDEGKSPQQYSQPPSHGFFSGSSVTMTTVHGPDGKIEQKRIVKDSSGREESTVTRSVDGQSHTVTTITGPQGLEERHEDFKNMDQRDIPKFEERWQNPLSPRQPHDGPVYINTPSPNSRRLPPGLDNRDMDLFSKFFGGPRQ